MKTLGTCVVVDADEAVRERIVRALAERWVTAIGFADVRTAVEAIIVDEHLALVIIDVENIDRGVELASTAQLAVPTPLVVALHTNPLPSDQAFELGRSGVRLLQCKPFTTDELMRAIDDQFAAPLPEIVGWVARFVGRIGLFDLEHEVRRAMVLQAVMASGQSRSAAADLLRAPRPVIQRAAPPATGRPRRRARRT